MLPEQSVLLLDPPFFCSIVLGKSGPGVLKGLFQFANVTILRKEQESSTTHLLYFGGCLQLPSLSPLFKSIETTFPTQRWETKTVAPSWIGGDGGGGDDIK